MAKNRKAPKGANGLELPFPSAPQRPGKYALYFLWGNKRTIHIFAAKYSAKKYLELVLGEELDPEKYELISKTQLVTKETGIEVRSHHLQEVLDHEYTKEEVEWEMPEPYPMFAQNFRYGPNREKVEDDPTKEPKSKKAPKKEKEPKEKKERKPRPDRTGLVSISDIAKDLKMVPRDARAILRSKKIDKPDIGWAWPPKEADKIKDLIEKNKK